MTHCAGAARTAAVRLREVRVLAAQQARLHEVRVPAVRQARQREVRRALVSRLERRVFFAVGPVRWY